MTRSYTSSSAYGRGADPTVACALCTGDHLARFCPTLDHETVRLVEADLIQRVHGTLAQAIRERRAGGHRSMCPPCRDVWNADQRRHRRNRRLRDLEQGEAA